MLEDAGVVAVERVNGDPRDEIDTTAHRMWRAIGHRLTHASWPLPTAVMAALGLWHIGVPQLWQDELVTVNVAVRSVRQIHGLLEKTDAVHGAYYVLMHFWIRAVGHSPAAVRTPSALAMAGAAGCVAMVGQRLFDRPAGTLAGLVFAVVPSATRFAQEARSYAFVVLATALATVALLGALRRPTVLRWVGYALCVTAIAYLNVVAVAVVTGHAVGLAVLRLRDRTWRPFLSFGLAAAGGLVLASPVIYYGSRQAGRQLVWIPRAGLWVVLPQTFASAWLGWAVLVVGALAVVRRPRSTVAFVAAMALLPPLVVWLFSLGELNYFFSKYLLFVLPAWAVVAGAGLAALRPRLATVLGFAALVALAVPGQVAVRGVFSHSWYTYPQARLEQPIGYADAAAIIASHYTPGDGVIYLRAPYWWYLMDVGVPYYLPANVHPRDVFRESTAAQVYDLHDTECPVSVRCMGPERRIFLVTLGRTDEPVLALSPDQQRALQRYQFHQVWVEHPSGLTVALLQRDQ